MFRSVCCLSNRVGQAAILKGFLGMRTQFDQETQ